MFERNVLIVAVDGLRASALGAYGNTSFATPALDQFAAESFLLDSCFAPAAELRDVYRALWNSLHPLRPVTAEHADRSLPRLLSSRGYSTTLVTDERELTSVSAAGSFDHCVQLATKADSEIDAPAKNVLQTAMARLFAAVCDAVEAEQSLSHGTRNVGATDSPRLVWVHSRGMYGPWDAPIDFQRMLLEEGDPPPLDTVMPPGLRLSKSEDPDAAFRYNCAYSAQTMVLDTCWNALMETVRAVRSDNQWLVVLIGVRGYPLGEHRKIGGVDERLYGEQLHVPWLIRFPDGHGRLARTSALASHMDLLPTLVDWIGVSLELQNAKFDGTSILTLASAVKAEWRDALFAASRATGDRAIRTATWCLLQSAAAENSDTTSSADSTGSELFVRPDDRWEANDVAKLCRENVERLAHASDELAIQIGRDQPIPASILSEKASPADL